MGKVLFLFVPVDTLFYVANEAIKEPFHFVVKARLRDKCFRLFGMLL